MVFSKPRFLGNEQIQWNGSDDAGKAVLRQQWLEVMLTEGVDHYRVNITRKKLKIVKAETAGSIDVLIRDPFEGDDDEDYDDGPISATHDAEEVVLWANRSQKKIDKIHSEPNGSYLASKFRFFRRLHYWMKMTAAKIDEYENAKEEARLCGYFELGESSRFNFTDFVDDPKNYSKENMESEIKSALELQEMDRMQRSDQEEEDYLTSSSDDEEVEIN